ncbi:MAG: BON domain-containing protein [Armatimonadota bacterium]|nr:BON domain-containing protein [Armatimonadota bacterium]
MYRKPIHLFLPALAGLAICLTGCSQRTLSSAQNDAQHDAAVVSHETQQAAQDAKPQLDKLGLQTRVETALTAANLPTTIHVRADAEGVYLRGTVSNAEDKARAGQIAKETLGPGKIVHNQLQVSNQ